MQLYTILPVGDRRLGLCTLKRLGKGFCTLLAAGMFAISAPVGIFAGSPDIAMAAEDNSPGKTAREVKKAEKKLSQAKADLKAAKQYGASLRDYEKNIQGRLRAITDRIDKKTMEIEKYQEQFFEEESIPEVGDLLDVIDALVGDRFTAGGDSKLSLLYTNLGSLKEKQDDILSEKIEVSAQVRQTEQKIMDLKKQVSKREYRLDDKKTAFHSALVEHGQYGGGAALDIPKSGTVSDYACSRIGCPYSWGATGSESFDCSGLVAWCYEHAHGISLPHNTEEMYSAAKEIVPVSEAKVGDVLYRSGHVAICIADGGEEYVHAPHSGAYVRIGTINEWNSFSCALRF